MDQNNKPKEVIDVEHEQKLQNLIEEFKECFQKDDSDIGQFRAITHKIVLLDNNSAIL